MSINVRAWRGADDTTSIQRLVSRLWPFGMHPGGLGWAAAGGQLADPIVLAEEGEGGELLGWAGIDGHHAGDGGELHLLADPAHPAVAPALVEWGLATADLPELTVAVAKGNAALRETVMAAGFEDNRDARRLVVGPGQGMFHPAGADGPTPPAGYRVRSVEDDELQARIDCHRAAWRPADMPLPAEVLANVSPDTTSRFDAPFYDRARATWLYDQSLDLVVEAPDGTFAACCIAWWDPAIGAAEIEPLGVVPVHRRRGLAGALCMQVAAEVAARHGEWVYINSAPDPAYPAPNATYASVGFELVDRGSTYTRRL